MAGNPWSYEGQTEHEYKYYIIEMLQNLKYLDYQIIDEEDRNLAKIKYAEALNDVKNSIAES